MQTLKFILIKVPYFSFTYVLDNICKKIFLWKTLRHYKNLWKPYGVIINNDLLKFHNNDIRKQIKRELLK